MEKNKIPHEVYEYPWSEDHMDAISVADEVGMPLEKIYKTLVTIGDKTGIVVACIPAENELDLKALAKVSRNKKIDMLQVKDLERVTGYIRGGCSPIGMKKLFPTYVAEAAQSMEKIVVSAGKRGMQVELTPLDLQILTEAVLANITST